eukprot:4717408-Prymnesium_polylepis.1
MPQPQTHRSQTVPPQDTARTPLQPHARPPADHTPKSPASRLHLLARWSSRPRLQARTGPRAASTADGCPRRPPQ